MRMDDRKAFPQVSDRIALRGSAGLAVSPVCIGMVQDPAVVVAAYDAGVNFFFLSGDLHWKAYEPLRVGLRHLSAARPASVDEAVVGVVTYLAQPDLMEGAWEDALREVDQFANKVLVVGGVFREDLQRRADTAARVHAACASTTPFGLTIHDTALAMIEAVHCMASILFIRYNHRWRTADAEVLPASAASDTPLFAFKTTKFAGRSPGTFADHYRFALGREGIDGVLCAPADVPELEALQEAIDAGPLPADHPLLRVDQ